MKDHWLKIELAQKPCNCLLGAIVVPMDDEHAAR